MDTKLFVRKQAGGMFSIIDKSVCTGNIFWVDSATGSDAVGYGRNPDAPFATLKYAFSSDVCTANNGDFIYVMEGHTEAPTTAITCDIAGVTVIGLGNGLTRPQITGGANNIDNVTITAEGVVFDGFYFNEATVSAANANINIAAAHVVVRNCHMDMGANDRIGISVTTAGEYCVIENNRFVVTANGPDSGVDFEAAIETPIVRNNVFICSDGTNEMDDGAIDFSGAAHSGPVVIGNVFDGLDDATPAQAIYDYGSVVGACFSGNYYAGGCVSDDNVSTVTATIGAAAITAASFGAGAIDATAIAANAIGASEIANGAIDAATFAAGAIDAAAIATGAVDADAIAADTILGADNADNAFASTSVVANADGSIIERQEYIASLLLASAGTYVPGLGFKVTKTEDVNTATADDLFTVTGKVLITVWSGQVTNALGAQPTDYQIKIKTSAEALCAATNLGTAAIGYMFMMNGDAGDTLLNSYAVTDTKTADTNGKGLANRIVGLAGGTCTLQAVRTAGDASDAIIHTIWYLPLEASASVSAAA